jgi:required for meiotic nuclear division protein 1
MSKILSYQISESIDIKGFRTTEGMQPHSFDTHEVFYITGQGSYLYIFRYGIVCFCNYRAEDVDVMIKKLFPYCRNILMEKLSEEFEVETNAPSNNFGFNRIQITDSNIETIRLIMLNVSQSVALDYYSDQAFRLMEETNQHTLSLEKRGKLFISGVNLRKYIGKTLNLKNRISENLYIFDSPDETWEDEQLNKVDIGLKRTFDLQERFRSIEENLGIVKENLDLFKDIMQHRNSVYLEWIIIILILVEVVNLFVEKLAG